MCEVERVRHMSSTSTTEINKGMSRRREGDTDDPVTKKKDRDPQSWGLNSPSWVAICYSEEHKSLLTSEYNPTRKPGRSSPIA